MEDNIEATVWFLKTDGTYDGVIVPHNGGMLELGKELLKKYNTAASARQLVSQGSIKNVKLSVFTMTAKEHLAGTYCYIFDEAKGIWLFGHKHPHLLSDLIKFIDR